MMAMRALIKAVAVLTTEAVRILVSIATVKYFVCVRTVILQPPIGKRAKITTNAKNPTEIAIKCALIRQEDISVNVTLDLGTQHILHHQKWEGVFQMMTFHHRGWGYFSNDGVYTLSTCARSRQIVAGVGPYACKTFFLDTPEINIS